MHLMVVPPMMNPRCAGFRMMLREDLGQPMRQDLVEELAQAALQADRADVGHAALLEWVLHQRYNHARLPRVRETGAAQTAVEKGDDYLSSMLAVP
jgi:hypothetical protein